MRKVLRIFFELHGPDGTNGGADRHPGAARAAAGVPRSRPPRRPGVSVPGVSVPGASVPGASCPAPPCPRRGIGGVVALPAPQRQPLAWMRAVQIGTSWAAAAGITMNTRSADW